MGFAGSAAGPTTRKARSAIPRCMSRIAPGKLRNSSKARALSARTSFAAEAATSPRVLEESVLVIAVTLLRISVSCPLVGADRLTSRVTLESDYSPSTTLLRSLQGRRMLERGAGSAMSGGSADQRQRPRLVELAQRVLHPPRDELVALVGIAAGAAEFLAQVDRREDLDRDLRGQGNAPREVEHRDAPRRRDLDRRDVDPQQPVEMQQSRDVLALAEEQRRLLAADRNDRA